MTAGGGAGGPDGVYDPDGAAYSADEGSADAGAPVPYDPDLQASEYSDAYTYESFVNDETQD